MSKKSFYCWYLGFTEAYGLQGHNRIYELVNNIIKYQNEKNKFMNNNNNINLSSNTRILPTTSKVTLKLSENSLTILDNIVSSSANNILNNQKRNNFLKSSRKHSSFLQSSSAITNPSPSTSYSNRNCTISYENITYVARLVSPPFSDIVIFIVKSNLNTSLGDLNTKNNNNNHKATFHLHAFRCDSEETATKMEQYLNYFRKTYWKRLDKHKAKQTKQSSSAKENSGAAYLTGYINKNMNHNNNNVNINFLRSNSPAQNDHLINNKVLLQNQLFKLNDEYRRRVIADNSSGDGTRSSSSPNELDTTPQSYNSSDQYHKLNYMVINERLLNKPSYNEEKLHQFGDIKKEITEKLKSGKPLLLPPKDYDDSDRERGNLFDIDNRNSKNELILGGVEAVKMRESNKYKVINHLNNSNENTESAGYESLNESELSFDEKANEAIKILDDVVDSCYADLKKTNFNSQSLNNINNSDVKVIYEFKPPSENNNNGKLRSKASSSSDLSESFFNDEMGVIKTNPLHIIDEETSIHPNRQKINFFEKLSQINNHNNNTNPKKTSDDSKRSQSFHKNSIINNKPSEHHQDIRKSTSINTQAANAGIRNGVFTKLGSYKPQWITENANRLSANDKNRPNCFSTNDLYHVSTRPTSYIDYEQQNNRVNSANNGLSRYSSHENINSISNLNQSKLKYSESERIIINNPNNMININPNNEPRYNNNNNNNINNNQKSNGSFTQKVITMVKKKNSNHNVSDYPISPNSCNSEFILKPASYIVTESFTAQPTRPQTSSSTSSSSSNTKHPMTIPLSNNNNNNNYNNSKNFKNTKTQENDSNESNINRYYFGKKQNGQRVVEIKNNEDPLLKYYKKKSFSSNYDSKFYSSDPHLALNKITYNGFYY